MLVKISAVLLGFFTVALTENLEAINPDGLDPTASHVCSSTISEYYTVSEEYTYYVEHITYTWCFAIPPRCRDVKVQKKTDWRNVVKSRQRKSYYCCNGYESREGVNYCYAKCKDNCNGYGYCIRPDICSCFQGHAGKFCESTCPEGSWGENCNRTCQCSTHGSCDPKHGSCICHIGYTGNDCSTPCQGAFGPHCIYQCRCENNATCDNVDGRCTCAPGYYGVYCHKECLPGTSGEDCEQLECQCQNGGTCDENRECICPDGYTGESCGLMCDDRHWGHNCSNLCYCYNGRCEPENGNCRCEMSYAGDHCQIQCKPGSYGEDCGTTCACQHGGRCYYTDESQNSVSCNCSGTGYHGASCHIRDCDETEYLVAGSCQACNCSWATTSSCNVLTGACQCNPGYKGDRCLENCKMPYFGQDCEETCECKHGDCHHVTGNCTQCYAGYRGVNCDQECPVGSWGVNCSESCTCQNGADCHETTGYCNCTRGFTGLYCAQRCPEGRYGYNCEGLCQCNNETSICSRTDGQCQCHSGYYGDYCQYQCPPNQYGFHCLYNCSCSENGTASCNHRTGECNCKAGWKGITCNSQCYEGTWGENCLRTCDCNNHGSCDQLLGHCICYPGYIGPECSQECPEGRYGFGCQETCQPCSDGAVCDFITGHCPLPGTCPAGFTGATCQELCPDGTWGVSCNESCASTCSGDRGRCNPINGQCRCFPGYTGIDCEHECDPGKYGIACQFRCQCIEESTESCNHKNGQCTCRPGFQGIFCEEQCAAGLWGPGCLFRCSDICNTVGSTGYCDFRTGTPCQCSTGYEGNHCQNQIGVSITEQQKGGEEAAGGLSPIVIAVIVIAVILVLVIVIIVVYYNRRVRKLKNDNLQVEFNANGVGTFDNSPSENHAPAGVLNPTYEAQNLNNEARYPHLSSRSRAAPAPNPPLATKGDQYLDSCSDRRTSGCYDEADEERYTTLKSVTDEPGANGDSLRDTSDVNIQKSRYEPKVSDKYVFYTGPKVPNSAAERSRLPSHDQQLKRDDLMKPSNLHLAQQTTVSNPSPTTSCSSLNNDIEPSDQTSGLSPALSFMNEQFGATTNVKQVHNETDNSKKTNSADSGMGQSVVPNQYTPVPHMSSFSDADPSFETSSGLPENFHSNTTGLLVNNTKPNPYDTPIPREERSDDSMQGTLSDGYLTPSVRSTNPYDTPRTTSLSSNPYDTPRALNPPVTDPGNDTSGDSQTGDWVTFNENEESSDQSAA